MSTPSQSRSAVSRLALNRTGLYILTVIVLVTIWEAVLRIAFVDLQLIFPPISEIIGTAISLLLSGALVPHAIASGQAIIIAVVLVIVIGVPAGTAIGRHPFVAEAIEPLLYYFSSVPKIVLYPLILMVLGIGLESKIAMGFLSAMFPITVNSIVAAQNIRSDHVQVARVYRASRGEMFKKVYLPSIAIFVVNGLRLGLGVAIISVMLAEIFASQAGLGNVVSFYFNNLLIEEMYATLLLVFVVAFALNIGLLRIQQYLEEKGYGSAEKGSAAGF